MSPSRTPATTGGGRPRDRRIDDSVIAAALAIMDSDGYGGLSLEAVARQAGTSRPAIYRRWSGRAPLALAAIADRLTVPVPPDSGCTLCDMGESFSIFLTAYRSIRLDVLTALHADCAVDPSLRAAYIEAIVEPARRAVGSTLDRAIARGDLRADTDRNLLLDLVGSLVQHRALFGPEHLSDDDAERAIEILLRGAAADYTALLAHSEALAQEHFDASGAHRVHLAARDD